MCLPQLCMTLWKELTLGGKWGPLSDSRNLNIPGYCCYSVCLTLAGGKVSGHAHVWLPKSSAWFWCMVKSQNPRHCRTDGGFMPLLTIWQMKVVWWSVCSICTFPHYDLRIFFTKVYKTLTEISHVFETEIKAKQTSLVKMIMEENTRHNNSQWEINRLLLAWVW